LSQVKNTGINGTAAGEDGSDGDDDGDG